MTTNIYLPIKYTTGKIATAEKTIFLFIAMSLFYGQNQFRRIAKADAVIHFLLQADCVV